VLSFTRLLKINFFLLILFLASCFSENRKAESDGEIIPDFDSSIVSTKISESVGFDIEYSNNYKSLSVFNPWQKSKGVVYRYLLVNRGAPMPETDGYDEVIRIPVKNVVCLSTTHIGFISAIDKTESIKGISGSGFVYSSDLKDARDVGYEDDLDYELILSLQPDVVFAYNISGDAVKYINKLKDLGIKVVVVGEYLEDSPLAKAEWIKFFSAFFNLEKEACDYFNLVTEEYYSLKKLTDSVAEKPDVLVGMPWKDAWHLPGGNSYQAMLIADAGGNYLWKENSGRESFILDLESIYKKAGKASVWINPGQSASKEDMIETDERLNLFESFKKGQIFNNNKRITKGGGMDYWESGTVNPHLVLKDLIHIFHPSLLPEHNLFYYQRIR